VCVLSSEFSCILITAFCMALANEFERTNEGDDAGAVIRFTSAERRNTEFVGDSGGLVARLSQRESDVQEGAKNDRLEVRFRVGYPRGRD
jgi:hypothetical protein